MMFGASGSAGAGVMTCFGTRSSWFAPVPRTNGVPAIVAWLMFPTRRPVAPAAAGCVSVVFSVGGGLGATSIVAVSWLAPESITIVWPARNPNGTWSRTPVAPVAVAPLSVVRSAFVSSWPMTVSRSSNEVVTRNVFVYLSALPAESCRAMACVCLPTVSRFRTRGCGITWAPSTSMRRMAEPPEPLATSVGSRRRGSVRVGVIVCDCRIMLSTICGQLPIGAKVSMRTAIVW